MTDPGRVDDDATLDVLLAARARAATDGRLVLDVVGGAALLGAALLWRPFAWVVLGSIGSCLFAFGAWGISDRELREHLDERRGERDRWRLVLAICRGVAAVVGAVSALLLIFALSALALGRWIS